MATATDEKAFMQVMASCTDACADMDFSDDNWKPPVGSYDVVLEGVTTGTKNSNGINNVWIKPTYRIIPPNEFEGRTFSDFMYIQPGAKELTPALRQLLRCATCLADRETRDPAEAAEIITNAVGEFLTVEFFESVGKKGKSKGKTFKNLRYVSLINATEQEAGE